MDIEEEIDCLLIAYEEGDYSVKDMIEKRLHLCEPGYRKVVLEEMHRISAAQLGLGDKTNRDRSLQRLYHASEVLHQAEITSAETIERLEKQTEQMRRINGTLEDTQQELSVSAKLASKLAQWWKL